MIGRRTALLVLALFCTALLAACGSGGSSTTTGSTSTSTPTTTAASTPTTTTSSTPSKTASTTTATTPTGPNNPAANAAIVKEYVAICKLIIEREPNLAANIKSKVEGICAKAQAGDAAGARAAAKEVCVEVISASPIPSAQKRKDLEACKTA